VGLEIWVDQAAHRTALETPAAMAMIEEAMPLIAEIRGGTKTVPIGGKGLPPH
jgi:hypothetical protein